MDTPNQDAKAVDDSSLKSEDRYQLIVIKLGNEEYGIHIDQIKEVVATPRITRIPQTPSYVKGVANIRGNILAIVDLAEKFGLQTQSPDTEDYADCYTLVVESDQIKMGILVKEVPNTLTVSAGDVEDTINLVPSTDDSSNYMLGIVKINQRLILLIDLFHVVRRDELTQLVNESAVTK